MSSPSPTRASSRRSRSPTSRPSWRKKPDIIVSIPVDAVATAAAYKAAADKGVKLVFMDNVPKGFIAGKDYVSSVSADNYGNGSRRRPSDGQGARRQGRDRTRLPCRRLLRDPAAL